MKTSASIINKKVLQRTFIQNAISVKCILRNCHGLIDTIGHLDTVQMIHACQSGGAGDAITLSCFLKPGTKVSFELLKKLSDEHFIYLSAMNTKSITVRALVFILGSINNKNVCLFKS